MDIFSVIKEPITTEKSTMLSDKAKYVFKINPDATKIDVKNAIKEIYGAEVASVAIINVRPKTRLIRGRNLFVKRKAGKKAVIRIKGGKVIDVTKFKDVKKESKKKQ
ncbi:50S ribosomal protein L23 [Candidatus Peregrinibacteria bacterium]|nr:50S ribosomal protein L23 [Candidatus Peregrinibacteria bacterium]